MNSTRRRFVRDEGGQELVEFALASLVFLMTIFGTLEFGLAVWQYNMVSNLAQEGARWASVRGSTSSMGQAVEADVRTFVQGRSAGINPDVVTTPALVGVPGSTFSVTVTANFSPLTQLIPLSVMQLTSTASMVVSR
ncbi:MAG: TadE/TadG family type IV pilus assembly protein [Acidobacteriota bacterium]